MKTALIIVDVQNDFCPGGALGVEDGDQVVEPANRLIRFFEETGRPVYFTRDWHPEDHCSFEANGGSWPPHCVAGTQGAEFHPDLYRPANAVVVSKAVEPDKEAYSGFEGTALDDRLKAQNIDQVVIAGLATDYCVKRTALDAHRLGFSTFVATDAVRAVNVEPEDGRRAIVHMQIRGIEFSESKQLIKALSSQ